MRINSKFIFRFLISIVSMTAFSACGLMPGFDFVEQPMLYYLPVGQVAKQVSCELQDVLSDFTKYRNHYYEKVDTDNPNQLSPPQWYISSDPVVVSLKLTTDNSGYVNFTGVDLGKVGLSSIANLLSTTSSGGATVPTLAAKITPKRTAVAALMFSVSPVPTDGNLSQEITTEGSDGNFKVGQQYSLQTIIQGGHPHRGPGPGYKVTIVGGQPPVQSPDGADAVFKRNDKGTGKNKETWSINGSLKKAGPFIYIIRVTDDSPRKQSIYQVVTGVIADSKGRVDDPNAADDPNADSSSHLMLDADPFKLESDGKFSQTNTAHGANNPTYKIIAGRVPTDTAPVDDHANKDGNWVISGKPRTSGPFAYIVRVTDDAGHHADQIVSGTIPSADGDPESGGEEVVNTPPTHCPEWATHPEHKLYLKNWLTNYFDKINTVTEKTEKGYQPPLCDIGDPTKPGSPTLNTPCIPDGTTFTQVELTTSFQITADISAGLAPSVVGAASIFLVPVTGLSADLNSDYTHSLDITLKICDNSKPGGCKSANSNGSADRLTPVATQQCQAYAALSPIMSGVTPPKDVVDGSNRQLTCNKSLGCYVLKSLDGQKNRLPMASDCGNVSEAAVPRKSLPQTDFNKDLKPSDPINREPG